MVKVPRLGRLRIPRLTQGFRTRLRAQARWWRQRLRQRAAADGQEVLFPVAGGGAIAVDTLAGDPAAPALSPRIAILHATAGNGHKRAAQALAASISAQRPDISVREVDTLVFASRLYRGTYAASYNAMAARAPALWSALYHSSALAQVNRGTAPVRLAMDRLNLRRLVRVLDRERPDAIVCTHFLPIEALSPKRGGGRLSVPLYCVITDFTAHPFWVFPYVDRYFVATERVASELHGLGVARERIEITGIPIDPRFAESIGRDAARARLGLDARRPTVLVMGGGSGVGPLAELAERVSRLALEPQVVVVCGMNAALQREVEALPGAAAGNIRAMGYTHDVDLLLEACDVVVSKAGGLTCAEALAKRTPLVVFRPTPGQEVRNAEYLEASGAAVHAATLADVERQVGHWLADGDARARARASAAKIAAPGAAERIARCVVQRLPAGGLKSA